MGTGSFPGVKRPGRGVDHSLHPAPSVKKEYCYISTTPLGLRGLYLGALYLYLCNISMFELLAVPHRGIPYVQMDKHFVTPKVFSLVLRIKR